MSIVRLLPVQDTSIVRGIEVDMGRDEVLELGLSSKDERSYPSRILMQFSQEQIKKSVLSENFVAKLHLTTTIVQNLPVYYTIKAYPLLESWEEGINRINGRGVPNTGATWKNRTKEDSWIESGGTYNGSWESSQGFDALSPTNLILDVTDIVKAWVQGDLENQGLLLKLQDEDVILELGTRISFYSANTHTIYAPFLEIGWDDSEYRPAEDLKEINEGVALTTIQGFQQEFRQEEVREFRLGVRPLYPARIFSTSSIYKTSYILPKESYWGIKNEYTGEMVVDFCEGTKISADEKGSYFVVDMGMLEPERYYRVLFQVQMEGLTTILDNRDIFKVVRK